MRGNIDISHYRHYFYQEVRRDLLNLETVDLFGMRAFVSKYKNLKELIRNYITRLSDEN